MAVPLKAPFEHGAILTVPNLDQCDAILDENHERLRTKALIGQRSLQDLRTAAAATLLREANRYLTQAGESAPPVRGERLVLAGHQPELFHPGVWLKNFALAGLARRHGIVAVNLVVDTDTMKSAGVRVPSPADEDSPYPHAHTILFDHWQPDVPYELCRIRNEDLFQSFSDRVSDVMRRWNVQPASVPDQSRLVLDRYWPLVRDQSQRTPLLGESLVAARRALERDWGCHNFEVPLSRLCSTEPFAHFAVHLFRSAAQLNAIYNGCVRSHRRRHGIRSRNHPVPDLATDADWLELPLWAWRAGDRRRSRLFVRPRQDVIELRAGTVAWPSLPSEPERAVTALLAMAGDGYALRPRALLTAMFARLILSDLFIHGIGGAKYDEVTDDIIRRFFGIEPPRFLIVSGTAHLPLPVFPVSGSERQHLARELRDMRFNPQRHLDQASPDKRLEHLAHEKVDWIARRTTDAVSGRAAHARLKSLIREMEPHFEDARHRLIEQLARLDAELKANAFLLRRDYAFCLFPESVLRPFCTQLL